VGFNLQTGEKLQEGFGFSGCGRLICTPSYTIGQLGSVYDPAEKKVVTRQYTKPFCSIGNIVANGMRYSAPHWCRCLSTFRGMLGFSSRTEDDRIVPAFPLETHDAPEPPAVETDPADWTQYRRDETHGCSSPAGVGRTVPAELWRYMAPVPTQLTAAIAVGDLVIVGGADGSVQCIDAKTGKGKWQYITDGKIFFPPTFADNRIYTGSSDGRVYCLSAQTGDLQWRFRAAPADQRLLVYDQLLSRWPANTNVVVNDGAVYVAAGLVDTDGVYVHRLDGRTGKLKWTNDTLGATSAKRTGVMPVGAMTLAKGRLWLRTDMSHPSFDLETGELARLPASHDIADADGSDDTAPKKTETAAAEGQQSLSVELPPRERNSMGMDLGVFSGKYLLDGGRRLYSDQSDRTQRCDTFVQQLNDKGEALYPRYMIASRTANMPLMPVWDNDLVVERPGDKITAIKGEEMIKAFTSVTAMDKGVFAVTGVAAPQQLWSQTEHYVNAVALSRDAVLIADGTAEEINRGRSNQKTHFTEWNVIAMSRETGEELWKVKLPAEPLYNAISIDRNGRIIVVCAGGVVVCLGH
jgi:outer membrane protein assembly factor BamB